MKKHKWKMTLYDIIENRFNAVVKLINGIETILENQSFYTCDEIFDYYSDKMSYYMKKGYSYFKKAEYCMEELERQRKEARKENAAYELNKMISELEDSAAADEMEDEQDEEQEDSAEEVYEIEQY